MFRWSMLRACATQDFHRLLYALSASARTGFASRAEASAFCDKLKAAGKNCFVK